MFTLESVTPAQTIAALEAIVAKYGTDHVYDENGVVSDADGVYRDGSCSYLPTEDEPGCIVGVFAREFCGVSDNVVRGWEGKPVDMVIRPDHCVIGVAEILCAVQFQQDSGGRRPESIADFTWGRALDAAKTVSAQYV